MAGAMMRVSSPRVVSWSPAAERCSAAGLSERSSEST
jgi:hypothetical protein